MAVARSIERPRIVWVDLLIATAGVGALALVIAAVTRSPSGLSPGTGAVSLSPAALPVDALLSWLRMAAAYALSLVFALVYAYAAAFSPRAERILIPILDILQSIPILSFLPVVLIAFIDLMPHSAWGPNLASVVLIFTSQVWNMVFSLYNAFITIPRDLVEAAHAMGLTPWQRFRKLELPFAMVGLVWNSMLSWAGGWFFLMAAEMFSLGSRSYRLAGLGTYLQTAANRGDWTAEVLGLGTLVAVIVIMDQLVFRPLLAWAEKFKVESVPGQDPPRSRILMLWRRSALLEAASRRLWDPFWEWTDRRLRPRANLPSPAVGQALGLLRALLVAGAVAGLVLALDSAAHLLETALPALPTVLAAAGATFLRVLTSLVVSALWTVPVGVTIGLNRRWSAALTPIIQILASVPATALFPGVVALLLHVQGGLNTAAVVLMVLGTQWYVLFNVMAAATAIPEDLKEATRLLRLRGWASWRTLILPAIFPYLVTGLITASGGAWNASIVAEYVAFQGHTYHVFGIGWLIAESSVANRGPLLLLATLVMALVVVGVNRLVWRPLYRLAAERYSLR